MPTCEVGGGLCTTHSAQLHRHHPSQLTEREYPISIELNTLCTFRFSEYCFNNLKEEINVVLYQRYCIFAVFLLGEVLKSSLVSGYVHAVALPVLIYAVC